MADSTLDLPHHSIHPRPGGLTPNKGRRATELTHKAPWERSSEERRSDHLRLKHMGGFLKMVGFPPYHPILIVFSL